MELQLSQIRKTYGTKEVLKDCTFTFEKGRLLPKHVGYVFATPVLPDFLTGYEFIKFYMDINEGNITDGKTIDEYFDLVKIDPQDRHRLIKGYSHGMKNKVQMLMFIITRLDSGTAFMALILFFLNCVLGSLGDSQIFSATRDKVTCIKYLHMNAKTFIRSYLAFKYVPFFLFYLIWLPAFSVWLGGNILQGIVMWIVMLSFRMMGEAFQLFSFDRTGKVICRSMLLEWVLIGVCLTGAYLPLFAGQDGLGGSLLLHPAAAMICAIPGGFSLWYITAGYPSYETKLHRSLDLNFLFFARHRRQLVKPVCYRLLSAALLFAASAVLTFADRKRQECSDRI